jgi:hypothetical protein
MDSSTAAVIYRPSTAMAGVLDVAEVMSVWYAIDSRTLALTATAIVFAAVLYSLLSLLRTSAPAERGERSTPVRDPGVPPRPQAPHAQLTAVNLRRMTAEVPPVHVPSILSSAVSSGLLRSENSLGSQNDVIADGLRMLVEFFGLDNRNHRMQNLRVIRSEVFNLDVAEVDRRCQGGATLRLLYTGNSNSPITPPEPFHAAKAVIAKLFPEDKIKAVDAMLSQIRVAYGRTKTNDKFWNIVWIALVRAHPKGLSGTAASDDSLDARVKRTVQGAMDVVMEQETS